MISSWTWNESTLVNNAISENRSNPSQVWCIYEISFVHFLYTKFYALEIVAFFSFVENNKIFFFVRMQWTISCRVFLVHFIYVGNTHMYAYPVRIVRTCAKIKTKAFLHIFRRTPIVLQRINSHIFKLCADCDNTYTKNYLNAEYVWRFVFLFVWT